MRKGKEDSDASPDKALTGNSSPDGSGAEVTGLFQRVAAILDGARSSAARAVNSRMVLAYWLIGREIVQELQAGEDRADYGKAVIDQLSARLAKHYGTGFSSTNLKSFRLFYLCYTDREPAIRHTLRAELPELSAGKSHTACAESGTPPAFHPTLSWSHYRAIMRLEKRDAREFYEQEAVASSWSVRQLERQIHSFYYERLLASSDQAGMIAAERNQGEDHPAALFKTSTVLEFLGLPDSTQLHESDLEQAIIDNLQAFLLEMGRGFAFVDRQKHIRFEDDEFYIDLVFYNYLLKCFVLVDLKIGKLTHQDIGQMDSYIRLYEDRFKVDGDNPTVGLILCSEKNETIARYSVLSESQQLFARKYRLHLPSEEELAAELKREIQLLKGRHA